LPRTYAGSSRPSSEPIMAGLHVKGGSFRPPCRPPGGTDERTGEVQPNKVMRRIHLIILITFLFFPATCPAGSGVREKLVLDAHALGRDYENFYLDTVNMSMLGGGIAGAAALANSSADREIQEYYRDDVRTDATNDASKILKLPGEVFLTVPVLLAAHLLDDGPVGTWAGRSLRGFFLGAPLVFVLQRVTGAGRPEEGDSHWEPFSDSNGVSGHAFTGAVPFITAAKMERNPYLKGLLYAASPIAALSRINDDKHFFSQAALGWFIAFLSASAVERTGKARSYTLGAAPLGRGGLVVFMRREF